jgi:hypothetical protein
MDNEIAVNLTASLHATAADLSGVTDGLTGLSTDDEIEQQAKILDRSAEDASEGAAILRAMIVRRKRAHGLLPRRVPRDIPNVHRVPPGPGSGAS